MKPTLLKQISSLILLAVAFACHAAVGDNQASVLRRPDTEAQNIFLPRE